MAIDPSIIGRLDTRLPLSAQVADPVKAIQGGILTRSQFDKAKELREQAPLRQKLLETQTETAGLALDTAKEAAFDRSIYSGITQAESTLKAGDLNSTIKAAQARREALLKEGKDTTETDTFLAGIEEKMAQGLSEDEIINSELAEIQQDKEALYSRGHIKRPELSKQDEEFLKGEINLARTTTQDIKKRANVINANLDKIDGLAKQMSPDGKLPRSAINVGIMSLARMVSPGVVTDRDAASIAGVADPVQAGLQLFDKMIDRGGDKEKIERAKTDFVRSFDPANPETFNVQGFKEIASTVAGAEAKGILNEWNESKNRAIRSNVGKNVIETNFGGDNESIFGLQKLLEQPDADTQAVQPEAGAQAAQPLPPTITNQAGQTGQLMIDANGNQAYVFPDNTIQEVQ